MAKVAKGARRSVGRKAEIFYRVVLREGGGSTLTLKFNDRLFYPRVAAWTRLLSSSRGLQSDPDNEARIWKENGLRAIQELAEAGKMRVDTAVRFIAAAAASGVVQVEMRWEGASTGWAARVFPWEAMLALATKEERKRSMKKDFLVLRLLDGCERRGPSIGDPGFAFSGGALAAGYDVASERAAIQNALGGSLQDLSAASSKELFAEVGSVHPRVVHLVTVTPDEGEAPGRVGNNPVTDEVGRAEETWADAAASHGPDIAAFSCCESGRRLAPLAVVKGARLAIGFHGQVLEASIPVFFGAFYRTWNKSGDVVASMRAALQANGSQADPSDLGFVTVWSSVSLIPRGATRRAATVPAVLEPALPQIYENIGQDELEAALPVNCSLEDSLNYSVLHNSRGGMFKTFSVTKVKPGKIQPLEVSVKLDTGLDRLIECHFFAKLGPEADRGLDLAAAFSLPLGSQILRRRGEIILGTVEVSVMCGGVRIYHMLQSIKLLPCDEWRDDESGRHLLPCFVFPRDPAVREILSGAQPFLRALCDKPQAGFDGYQAGFSPHPEDAARLQVRATWAVLQNSKRLDYVSPPPSYTRMAQRLRTPEEILRAGRGTCIELALLLASCWEHIGIFPVIFLIKGHAFVGYWSSGEAHGKFIDGLDQLERPEAFEITDETELKPAQVELRPLSKKKELWMFSGVSHLVTIREQIRTGALVPVEATCIPLQRPFADAVREAADHLRNDRGFDCMIDMLTARREGVTPLAIINQGIPA